MQEQLDLLFGQHLSSVVACSVYGVARTLDVATSFKRICGVMIKCMPILEQSTFQQVELNAGLADLELGGSQQQQPERPFWGELRVWYNSKFLPRMEQKLLRLTDEAHRKPPAKGRSDRLPLKSLSAHDINARQGR